MGVERSLHPAFPSATVEDRTNKKWPNPPPLNYMAGVHLAVMYSVMNGSLPATLGENCKTSIQHCCAGLRSAHVSCAKEFPAIQRSPWLEGLPPPPKGWKFLSGASRQNFGIFGQRKSKPEPLAGQRGADGPCADHPPHSPNSSPPVAWPQRHPVVQAPWGWKPRPHACGVGGRASPNKPWDGLAGNRLAGPTPPPSPHAGGSLSCDWGRPGFQRSESTMMPPEPPNPCGLCKDLTCPKNLPRPARCSPFINIMHYIIILLLYYHIIILYMPPTFDPFLQPPPPRRPTIHYCFLFFGWLGNK